MIVRKPYAFFIKHFRLFHIIFLLIAFKLIVTNISLFEFFSDYINSNPTVISSFIVDSIKTNIIWPIILLIGLGLVMGVLIYKKKDIKLYIITIVSYTLITVLFVIANRTLDNLTRYLVDIRIVKAIHDILLVSSFAQAILIVLLFTRATGFDIKKFDFAKDYAEMQVLDEDREEVELSLDFDISSIKTRINRFFRKFKYFYLENKLVCISIIVISIIAFCLSIYFYINNSSYVTVKGNVINSRKYVISYINSFIDNKNASDKIINGNNFVILQANIKLRGSSKNTFNTSNLLLIIDNKSYVPLKKYNQYFEDFGVGYADENIDKSGDYYFVYDIPGNVPLKNIKLVYVDIDKYYQKNIDYIDLRDDNFIDSYVVGDNIKIDIPFMTTDFKIEEVSFKEKFLVPYIFKTSKNYYSSSYYVAPSISGNYDKSVIRFVSNDCSIIEKYGVIYYDEKKSTVSLKKIQPIKTSSYCYFESDREILNANSIYLNLNIRGNVYKYYLR